MSLLNELKRRNVFRVAAAYVVIAWLLIQVLGLAASSFEAPAWVMKMIITGVVIGFIPAVLFSWAFELTPEGIKKEKNIERDDSITNITAKKLDYITLAAAVGVLGLFAYQQMNPATPQSAPDVALQSSNSQVQENTPETDANTNAAQAISDNSIAVLPFVDMSQAKDQEYFTDGLTENLLHALAQIREIKVAGRTSSFAFKNLNTDLREIGQTLNVQKILEGSVQKSGMSLRITAQLINADDGFHIWSQTYDRELEDIFAVQDEITAAVVQALRKSMLTEDELSANYTGNFEAYDAYLLGLDYHKKRNQEAYEKAIEQYQLALKIDPNMALAWAGLSRTYSYQTGYGSNFTDGFKQARAAALKAIELDPNLPEAYLALADVQSSHDWDWDGFEASLRRAYSLRPGDADIVSELAGLKSLRGNFTEALADIEQALVQDPLNEELQGHRAGLYVGIGRAAEALPVVQGSVSKYPERGTVHFGLSRVYYELGDYEQALAIAKDEKFKFLRLQLESILNDKLGNTQVANAKLNELIEAYGDDVSWQVAAVYAARGDADQAFAALERGFTARDPGLIYIQSSNWFFDYHDDPRYQAFLKKMGFRK